MAIDMTGQRFGRLTVLRFSGNRKNMRMWACICDCGNHIIAYANNLRRGLSKSCGCLKIALAGTHSITHGLTNSTEYRSWCSAKERCFNPTNKKYKHYGGRGITMCDRWRNDFAAFYCDMGPKPPNKTLDRIDNDGNYEPGNCRWATPYEQMRNRQDAIKATHNGETLPIKEWAERTGMRYETLRYRFMRGLPMFRQVASTRKK